MSIESLLKRKFKDKRFKTRNCAQLLSHLGRFEEDVFTSWEANPFALAAELNVPLRLRMQDVVDWVAKDLDDCFTDDDAPKPGTTPLPKAIYSGAGMTMLAQICAERYKELGYPDLQDGVLNHLFARVGVKRPRARLNQIAKAGQQAETSEEVRYHASSPACGLSQQHDNPKAITPVSYDPTNSDVYLGNGTWAMSCADYARILAAFDESPNPLFDNPLMQQEVLTEKAENMYRGFFKATWFVDAGGQPVDAMWHNGELSGGTSVGFRRMDGITIVYAYNTNLLATSPILRDVDANKLVNLVATWPTFDLFSAVL